MRMSRFIGRLLLAAALGWSANAAAQTCTLASSTGLNFGTNLASPTAQIDVNGSVTLSCSGGGNNQDRRVCLSLGTGAPVPNPRQMTSGANTAAYQVYSTVAGGTVVATANSESGGLIIARTYNTSNGTVTFPLAGRLLAGQNVPSGAYSASLVIGTAVGPLAPDTCQPSKMVAAGGNFAVSAGFGADCTLDIPNVSFGTVTNLTAVRNTSTNASVTCTTGAPWTLSLSAGSTPGNTYAARYMSVGGNGAPAVRYQIYRDAGPANVWGNGSAGTVTRTGTGTGATQSIPVYLQVPVQAPSAEGTYSDTVTATLTF